jgi:ribosomal protein S27E
MSDSQCFTIMCPNLACRKVLAVPESARGKTVRCRNCTTTIRIPAAGENRIAAKPPAKGREAA